MKKIIFIILIIITLLVFQSCYYIFYKGLPEQINKLEYRIPLQVMTGSTQSKIHYKGITGKHKSNYYEFTSNETKCELRVEYFEGNVTDNSELYLIKTKKKDINDHKWYYSLNKYFTTYKGDTYVVQTTNKKDCNKINNNIIKSLKLK